jgi:hypothetical protein
MTTIAEVAAAARHHLRDFPEFFTMTTENSGRTYKLPHRNVIASSLVVRTQVGVNTPVDLVAGTNYNVDERNGYLRLTAAPTASSTLLIEGYYYQWLLDEDLTFAAGIAERMITSNLNGISLGGVSPVVADVISIACVVEALWSLAAEFSRDIDVSHPEGVHIPASERYRQIMPLLQYWSSEYEKRARALNIGLERIEQFTLRRISRTTNMLVPIWQARELGDSAPSTRHFPPIDPGIIPLETPDERERVDALVDIDPVHGVTTTYYQ